MTPLFCAVEDCAVTHWAKGYCRKHYRRWRRNGTPELATGHDRFWRHVERRAEHECWPWTGATVRGHGHGHDGGQHFYAHRRSYEMHCGPIPEGMVVRHKCDNPQCVNPAHLEIGTQPQNINDMIVRGRGWWQQPCAGFASRAEAVDELSAAGLTRDEIAIRTGMHRETVRRQMKRMGLSERRVGAA